jgi:L-asparaginase
MSLQIFVTGGTFDKKYNEIDGTLSFDQTHVSELLDLGRCQLKVEITTLMLVDSLDMTEASRELILAQCAATPAQHIVITHGTDTMVETAQLLGEKLAGKTIVLTGAMIPFTFGSSDGLFNMGCALAFAQSLPPSVYVAMNGRCFHWNNVRKNRVLGRFEENI